MIALELVLAECNRAFGLHCGQALQRKPLTNEAAVGTERLTRELNFIEREKRFR